MTLSFLKTEVGLSLHMLVYIKTKFCLIKLYAFYVYRDIKCMYCKISLNKSLESSSIHQIMLFLLTNNYTFIQIKQIFSPYAIERPKLSTQNSNRITYPKFISALFFFVFIIFGKNSPSLFKSTFYISNCL